jgi:BlaI family penicillinase repressor
MTTPTAISDAESLVMRQLWQRSPQTAEDLAATLGTAPGWQPATVANAGLSLIDRLFGGRLAPLVAQFASQRKLTADDLAALKALLKAQDHD